MSTLRHKPARPRARSKRPSYPRSLTVTVGVGAIALAAACGGSVEVEGTPGETVTHQGGNGWGGGLDGAMPEPYGGGGYGATTNQGGWAGGLDGGISEPYGGGGVGGTTSQGGFGGGLDGGMPEPYGGGGWGEQAS